MTGSRAVHIGARRQRVVAGRVLCPRLGAVLVDRCRECAYLVRLENAVTQDAAEVDLVCAGDDPQLEFDFAW